MYPQDLLEKLFDQDTLTYLNRKNIGGTSSDKGNTYESFFAIYQITQWAEAFIEQGQEVHFTSQVRAFVDDLIIICKHDPQYLHFQLKNSQTVAWNSGLHSIANDFENQYQLNQAIASSCQLTLVVSHPDVSNRLTSSIPPTLQPYSQVMHFPYEDTLIKLIKQVPQFRSALIYLSAFRQPAQDRIEAVAAVLLGAWFSSNRTNIALSELLTKAQQCQPSFIRSLSNSEPELDLEVITILSQIENFTYTLDKGFFHWEFQGGLDQGTLLYSCETDQFRRFQDLVKQATPTSFEELEGFLL